jgi:IS5 family transposase
MVLRVAHEKEALSTKDPERVAVDTTVQPKVIAHPTDARFAHQAIEKLSDFAKRDGIKLRQSRLGGLVSTAAGMAKVSSLTRAHANTGSAIHGGSNNDIVGL